MTKYKNIINKIVKKQDVYLKSSEGCVIKIPANNTVYHVKFKNAPEYTIEGTTDLACETLLEANEITKQEYDNY